MVSQIFTLDCEKLTNATFIGFRGKEQISRPYEFQFFFSVPAGTAVRAAVGQRATLRGARHAADEPVVIHGVIASVRLLHQLDDRSIYGALLVPRLWLLRHFWRSYVFTGKTLKEFLSDTLQAGGLVSDEFRFDIDTGLHTAEEFVAQYRESHLDFFHRWLEREGLYYYFEHKPDAAAEVLVIVEDKSHNEDFVGGGRVRYIPLLGDDATSPPGLHHIEADIRWLPKTVTLSEYDYANPSLALTSDSSVTEHGVGTIVDYGHRAFAEKDVKRITKVKAQAIGCHETTLRGSGDALGPRAGYRFAIDDRPDDLDEAWLAVEVELSANVAATTPEVATLTGLPQKVYELKVFAVPANVQYRAPQTTAWPRIYGFENGLICGEAESPYAQIDADGRYLVRFEFDTSDLADGKVSTRVRMLQPHGGTTEGFHFPLRKGTEVMIAFLGGDPDRPFIAGVVPNAHKPSVVGQRNNTQNIIRTGSNNQIVMEDEKGKEFIFIHTPNKKTGIYLGHPTGDQSKVYTGEGEFTGTKFFTKPGAVGTGSTNDGANVSVSFGLETDGDYGLFVVGDSWTNVFGKENVFVYGDTSHGYLAKYTIEVGGDVSEHYFATQTITTHAHREDTVEGGGMKQTITGGMNQTINDGLRQRVVGGGHQDVTGNWRHLVTGRNEDIYGSWDAVVRDSIDITCTGGTVTITSPTEIVLDAPKVTNNATGQWFKKTAVTLDLYGSKNAIGLQKFDAAALSAAVTGIKREASGFARAFTAAKQETVGVAKSTTLVKIDDTAFRKQNTPLEVTAEAIKSCTGGMMSFAKAFMKL